ncbi:hypothetical protein AADG42_00330 [Ammonicoccus fulvus]|uniref:Serine hydrolase n=1 Tax=Ammonicoccus fulvus TaxID=3138240 RepID=A0ABZ3FLW5_9ACTN
MIRVRPRRLTTLSAVTVILALTGCSLLPAGPGSSSSPAATATTPLPRASSAGASTRVPSPTPTPATASSSAPTVSLPEPSNGSEDRLRASFAALPDAGSLSIAIVAVGSDAQPIQLGEAGSSVAWSTAKVPLAIAVERGPRAEALRPTMQRAITASDNDAALELWRSLGTPEAAGRATDRVLRDFGDATTTTQTEQVRPPYTPFGQTRWSVGDQARFAAHLPCRSEAAPVYSAMGQVITDQRWGLGRIPDARFKGGWGPSSRGYLVRQLGVIDTPRGQVAVAITTDAGSFEDGTAVLSRAARWLQTQQDHLPAGRC